MKDEALKLALEALEESQTDNDTMEFWDRKSKAITAVKEALAQPEQEPAKRPWVGLTDEEIDYLYVDHRGDGGPTAICEQFARAVLAKSKEKNT